MLDYPAHDPTTWPHMGITDTNGQLELCLFHPALLLAFSLLKETYRSEATSHKSIIGSQHLVPGSSKNDCPCCLLFCIPNFV